MKLWKKILLSASSIFVLSLFIAAGSFAGSAYAGTITNKTPYHCGAGNNMVYTSIDLGCQGQGNPIMDMLFAFIRFLTNGAGLVIIASLIWAGIQYTSSRGEPQASAAAKTRIESTIIALLVFIFAYAILNYLLPDHLLR